MSGKKILAIGFVVVLLVAIPLTVFLIQQQQKAKTNAIAATTLSLTPASQSPVTLGTNVTFAVMLDPGTNQVSFVKLTITYDSSQLATAGAGLVITPWVVNGTQVTPTILQEPSYGTGTISMTISVQGNPQNVISTPTQIASVTFDITNLTGNTTVGIDKATSQVLSINSGDQFNENVLLDTIGATINPPAVTAAPTATPTVTPAVTITSTVTPTLTVTPTVTPTVTQQTTATGPVCSSLTLASGSDPDTVNLTANGQDSASTISQVTFDFGDGQTQNVTDFAGSGTNSVSVLQSHVYNASGNYTATAVFTDASGSVSPVGNCSVAINVNSNGSTTGGGIAAAPTAMPTATPATIVATRPSPLPATGPAQLVSVGAIGGIITVIGALLLLAL